MTEKPPCAVCGQPYHRHNIGAMATCPIIATYRPTPATDVSAEDGARAFEQITAIASLLSRDIENLQAAHAISDHLATIRAALQSQAAKLKEVKAEWDEARSIANDAGELLKRQEAARLAAEARLAQMRAALTGVLDTSGARGEYHALKYADAVEAAEALLTDAQDKGEDRER